MREKKRKNEKESRTWVEKTRIDRWDYGCERRGRSVGRSIRREDRLKTEER